jgi:hypothetical protein
MRLATVTHLDLAQVDLAGRRLMVVEKGGATHTYQISRAGGTVPRSDWGTAMRAGSFFLGWQT